MKKFSSTGKSKIAIPDDVDEKEKRRLELTAEMQKMAQDRLRMQATPFPVIPSKVPVVTSTFKTLQQHQGQQQFEDQALQR